MSWHPEVSREAEKVLLGQDRRQRLRLREAIDELHETPYPLRDRDTQLVQGQPGLWRLRVGGWRVLYTVHEEARTVYVVAVRPRGQAYRGFEACDRFGQLLAL
jgi:mRNA interferase RelE/StbE